MRRALVELMTGLKYQKVLPLRSDPWSEKENVNRNGVCVPGKSLVSPASHLFRQGSFTDFHLSHILFRTEGGMEVISCHVICCRQSEPWFVSSFGSKNSNVNSDS